MADSKGVYIKKLVAALLFAAIFAAVAHFVNRARSFTAGFGTSYLIWTVVNGYDAFAIDCLWLCHDKQGRIPDTEDMKEYQDYWFHIRASLRGQVIGLPIALVAGGLTEALARL